MTIITILAAKLDQELKARGIFDVAMSECAEIVRELLKHGGKVAASSIDRPPPKGVAGR